MRRAPYRHIVESEAAFIRQLAVSYVGGGFWFYVTGAIPEGKDPVKTDEKLLRRYQIGISKWARARRKKAGLGNVHYLRHGRLFVLLASHGAHRFFLDEDFRDCRRAPIKAFGYAVSYRKGVDGKGHASVRISREEYLRAKSHFESIACHRSAEALCRELGALRFEPFAPVRRQLLNILRAVNRARGARGFEPIPHTALRLRPTPQRIFVEEPSSERAGAGSGHPAGAGVRSEGTGPELRVQRVAQELGLHFRVNAKDLSGSPDLVFDDLKTALFVHGCFWHSHPGCAGQRIPFPTDEGKRAFWHDKLIRNALRDERVARELERAGWQVVVLWECQTRSSETLAAALRALTAAA